jgi:hypothetical protein
MSIPNVVVDFTLEHSCLFLVIQNRSDAEATSVKISFNRPIILSHKKNKKGERALLNELSIFSRLRYLAPQKELRVFVDQIDAFNINNKLLLYRLVVNYKDLAGKKNFQKIIRHDLSIYKDFPILLNHSQNV